MANAAWKKIEKSDGFRRVKLAVRRATGKEPRIKPDIRVHLRTFDCWRLCPDLLSAGRRVYSLGVGDTIDFDLQMIESLGVEVHAFDPTPHSLTWIEQQELPPGFHFHPWAAADRDGKLFLYPRIKSDGSRSTVMYTIMEEDQGSEAAVEVPALTLTSMMEKLGHDSIDLLKMDIEGAEYGVIEGLLASDVRPDQLLIEFHHRFRDIGQQRTLDAVAAIRGAGYGLADIAPTGREFCFIRRSALRSSSV